MTDRRMIRHWGTWDEIRANFRWNIPARFNIAEACCDSWARDDPDRLALTHVAADGAATTWSYGQLKRASDRLAASFAARGVGPGDRVGVLLEQGPEVLITHFAAQKRGAIVLPLFSLFGPDALSFRLADSGAKLVVTDAGGLAKIDAIRADLPDLAEVYATDPASAPVRNLWDEIEAARPIPPVETGPDDPALLVYTSGTTGPPKGALHAHRVLLGHLPGIECQLERFPQPGDVGWTPADWAWIGGLMDLAMPCLYHGVPLISHRMRKFDPDRAFDLIARHKVRTLFLPPTALKLMRRASVPEAVDIRAINSGGESLGPDLLDWGREVLGAPINEIYGQTECNLVVNTMASAMEVRPGMIGQPVPGHEVAIIDADGHEVPRGETGEIAVKRPDPVMFLGYWNQPEKTAEKFIGDWLKTGDLGMMDADGYVGFVSRDDDVITSAGYRIGPSEIEHCLNGHPDVVMAAVVGVPDALRTEVVKAFVIARDGTASDTLRDALIQRVRDKVSPHVAPRALDFVDSLPLTATGKIMRRSLREG
nr:AMP-binding protein [Maritimibacter fusiformis]